MTITLVKTYAALKAAGVSSDLLLVALATIYPHVVL
jgi:hypothetical protein